MLDQILEALRALYLRREWSDLVELLIIGAGVYAIMRFLRGTRGARLLRGFVLLLVGSTVVVSLAANVLDLERIKVLYPYFVAALFLVALVAFQPELRRALIRLGAASWFVGASGEVDRAIEAIVDAITYLSKNKIGALIALERSTELGPFVQSGCRVDAEVSKELLNTIFWPGSALHDMGVVISQGRLAAAAVQFPLIDSDDELDPTMGSRHRAALGLSQESDAVVVVVSEETGTISVAETGRLERFLTPDSLRHLLKIKLGRGQAPSEESGLIAE
jgi:diadenylate cyclase